MIGLYLPTQMRELCLNRCHFRLLLLLLLFQLAIQLHQFRAKIIYIWNWAFSADDSVYQRSPKFSTKIVSRTSLVLLGTASLVGRQFWVPRGSIRCNVP